MWVQRNVELSAFLKPSPNVKALWVCILHTFVCFTHTWRIPSDVTVTCKLLLCYVMMFIIIIIIWFWYCFSRAYCTLKDICSVSGWKWFHTKSNSSESLTKLLSRLSLVVSVDIFVCLFRRVVCPWARLSQMNVSFWLG